MAALARVYYLSERQIQARKARDGDWQRIIISGCDDMKPGATVTPGERHAGEEIQAAPMQPATDPVLQAVGDTVGALIDAGLPDIEPPRNLRQLGQALNIYRQARGIASSGGSSGPRVLINLGAGIRPRMRDAGTVLEAD